MRLDKLREYLKTKASLAISLPTVLCFIQFVAEIGDIIKAGKMDNAAFTQLLSSANGFETVVLVVIMIVLKEKSK